MGTAATEPDFERQSVSHDERGIMVYVILVIIAGAIVFALTRMRAGKRRA
jgi:hypothetical protein